MPLTARDALISTLSAFYADARPGRMGVAVSGGSDSLALLHLMAEWGGTELEVATVNHGLRPEAASEALHVERVAGDLGLPHTILEWTGWDGKGNLQDQARRSRYEILAGWASGRGLDAVAVGHTRDDVAETFLMRLGREAGVSGLSAMSSRFVRDGTAFHRPLLTHSREDLRDYLESEGVRWVEDPSNTDEDYERVRAREAIRLLEGLDLDARKLSRVATQLGEARTALSWAASRWAEEHVRVAAGDVYWGRTAFLQLPVEMRRRLISAALTWVSSSEYSPRRAGLQVALDAVTERANTVLHGCRILVSDMTVRVTRELAAVAQTVGPTDEIWDRRWRLEGPHNDSLEVRPLGDGIVACDAWRDTGIPRISLLASPAVWKGETLVSAPLAGLKQGWRAKTCDKEHFLEVLISH